MPAISFTENLLIRFLSAAEMCPAKAGRV